MGREIRKKDSKIKKEKIKIDAYRKKFIAVFLIGLLFGAVGGTIYGMKISLDKCAQLASDFIDIDYDKVREMIELYDKYRWKIKGGYNAPILNNTGN